VTCSGATPEVMSPRSAVAVDAAAGLRHQWDGPADRTAVPKLYWDDIEVGAVAEYGPRVVTREEIMAFAAEFDPQPMHLSEDAARLSMLGGLAASGWHTCSVVQRIVTDGFLREVNSMGAPGVDEVKWLKPVRPGDRLTVRTKAVGKRPSRSRPELGFVEFMFEVLTQTGAVTMTMTTTLMVARRDRT
jgi:acyl dehydratase